MVEMSYPRVSYGMSRWYVKSNDDMFGRFSTDGAKKELDCEENLCGYKGTEGANISGSDHQ